MDREGLAKLPGRPEEQAWLQERLEVLTVREGIALDAAIQRHPAQDSTEAVCLLASLDEYEVLGGIQSYEDLGLYYLEKTSARLLALRDYIDLDKLGRRYEEQHPDCLSGVAMRYIRSGNRPSHTTASPCRGRTTAGACG